MNPEFIFPTHTTYSYVVNSNPKGNIDLSFYVNDFSHYLKKDAFHTTPLLDYDKALLEISNRMRNMNPFSKQQIERILAANPGDSDTDDNDEDEYEVARREGGARPKTKDEEAAEATGGAAGVEAGAEGGAGGARGAGGAEGAQEAEGAEGADERGNAQWRALARATDIEDTNESATNIKLVKRLIADNKSADNIWIVKEGNKEYVPAIEKGRKTLKLSDVGLSMTDLQEAKNVLNGLKSKTNVKGTLAKLNNFVSKIEREIGIRNLQLNK